MEQEQWEERPLAHEVYRRGRVFRVVKPGASLSGMTPMRGGHRGWGRPLEVGEQIECRGFVMGWGSDSIPVVQWAVEGVSFVEVRPNCGLWKPWPQDGFLTPVDEIGGA